MAAKPGIVSNNRLVSAAAITLVSIAVIFGIHFLLVGSGPLEPTTPIAIEPIDSSNCIACHTDAEAIERLAVLDEDGGHGGEGG